MARARGLMGRSEALLPTPPASARRSTERRYWAPTTPHRGRLQSGRRRATNVIIGRVATPFGTASKRLGQGSNSLGLALGTVGAELERRVLRTCTGRSCLSESPVTPSSFVNLL